MSINAIKFNPFSPSMTGGAIAPVQSPQIYTPVEGVQPVGKQAPGEKQDKYSQYDQKAPDVTGGYAGQVHGQDNIVAKKLNLFA